VKFLRKNNDNIIEGYKPEVKAPIKEGQEEEKMKSILKLWGWLIFGQILITTVLNADRTALPE